MTVTDTTTTTAHLDPAHVDTIAEMLQRGRRVSEVIAAGLHVQGGWRRPDVLDVVSARGWKLDSDGRIPARFHTTAVVPVTTIPGAPGPTPGRPVPWPERGTVTADRADDGTGQLIADGKAHTVTAVRKLAEKAETAVRDLRAAVKAEESREGIRRRLAELDAERDRLRAQLGGPGRPKKAAATDGPTPAPAPATKPIDHGTERGARQHNLRGDPLCDACRPFQDVIVAKLRGGKKETGQ